MSSRLNSLHESIRLDRLHKEALFKELISKNGKHILGGSIVKTPDGKQGYVYQIMDDDIRVTAKPQTDLIGWFKASDLIVVKEAVGDFVPVSEDKLNKQFNIEGSNSREVGFKIERKEHPSFSDEQVYQIVDDHLKLNPHEYDKKEDFDIDELNPNCIEAMNYKKGMNVRTDNGVGVITQEYPQTKKFEVTLNKDKSKIIISEKDLISFNEAFKPGDKVHCPSGFCKVIKITSDGAIVRTDDGDIEYKNKDMQKE